MYVTVLVFHPSIHNANLEHKECHLIYILERAMREIVCSNERCSEYQRNARKFKKFLRLVKTIKKKLKSSILIL